MGLKPCNIKNCPCFKGTCSYYNIECYKVDDCIIKKLCNIAFNRHKYVQNKLCGCFGYSNEQKKIRYEELQYIMREVGTILDIEVEDGNSCMVEGFVEK